MSELLCHCDGDHLGHELGLGLECPRIRPGHWLRPEIRTIGERGGINFARVDARGTCPVCRRNVRVVRIQVHAEYARGGRRLPPVENPAKPRGSAMEIRPGMAPHTVDGAQCLGTGKVPTETRYTPGKELASYLAVLAEENEEKSA